MLRSATSPFLRSTVLARNYAINFSKRAGNSKKNANNGPKTLFDEDIRYPIVQLTDPDSGQLHPPKDFKAILNSINRDTHLIQLVNNAHYPPIVKLVSKASLKQREINLKAQARAQARATAANAAKEVQISGDVALHDLEHKLTKVEEILKEDRRVDLVLTKRKAVGPGDPKAEMHERARNLIERFVESGMAVEYQTRELRPHLIALFLQGKGTSAMSAAESLSDESRKTSIHKFYWNGVPSEIHDKLEKVKSDLAKGVFVELALSKRAERKEKPKPDSKPVLPPPSTIMTEEDKEKLQEEAQEKIQIAMNESIDSILSRLSDFSSEWREREVKSGKAILFLQPSAQTQSVEWKERAKRLKTKAMVHKGPKMRKQEVAGVQDDLYQD